MVRDLELITLSLLGGEMGKCLHRWGSAYTVTMARLMFKSLFSVCMPHVNAMYNVGINTFVLNVWELPYMHVCVNMCYIECTIIQMCPCVYTNVFFLCV